MTKIADVKRKVLEANAAEAERLRTGFEGDGTLVTNLISSPGSGKTTLLEATIPMLKDKYRIAALDGDIATARDAERLEKAGAPALQILTGGACHLDARKIGTALDEAEFGKLDFLFIENVGNLICPTSYDLGEDFKVVLLSVTEGDDKPFKYPGIFSRADVAVVTKSDLLPYVDFDLEAVQAEIKVLRPEGTILVCSVKTGDGLGDWINLLMERLEKKRSRATHNA